MKRGDRLDITRCGRRARSSDLFASLVPMSGPLLKEHQSSTERRTRFQTRLEVILGTSGWQPKPLCSAVMDAWRSVSSPLPPGKLKGSEACSRTRCCNGQSSSTMKTPIDRQSITCKLTIAVICVRLARQASARRIRSSL